MPSNYVEFPAPTGLTLTAKLFLETSDIVAYTAAGVVEQSNRKGIYKAEFLAGPTGTYQIIGFDGSIPVAEWWVSLAEGSGTYTAGERALESAIAGTVWDEAYASHTTAGTFGKLMDILRKTNQTIEGQVTPHISPTTIQFSSDVTGYPDSAFKHALVLFINGSTVSEQNSPIVSYTQSNGVFVLEEPLTSAPLVGDTFIVIAGTHVHSILEIAQGVRAVGTSIRATQASDGTISLYNGMTYDGTAHPKLSFDVTKDYATADSITLSIYQPTSTATAIKLAAAAATSSTLVEVTSLEAVFSPTLTYTGNPLICELRYTLIADWNGPLETIAAGPLFVYDTPPTA